ncbi:MAG: M23 family metallopeptidase [bacterium]|nr:M23 family metallopeptidase [bacterium]
MGTEAGIYPLELSITPDGGQSLVWSINIQVQTGQYGTQYITLPEDRANLLAPAVEENELNLLRAVTTGFNAERYFDGPMGLPAAAVMNSPFGVSRAYNGGPVDRYHNGADFAGAPGSPVLAAAPGRVVLADSLYIRGNTLMIDHGWGVYTVYAHLSERYVNLGDFVSTGQRIGAVGSTGRATGAHLHWEVWVNGVAVDPMQWVREAFP